MAKTRTNLIFTSFVLESGNTCLTINATQQFGQTSFDRIWNASVCCCWHSVCRYQLETWGTCAPPIYYLGYTHWEIPTISHLISFIWSRYTGQLGNSDEIKFDSRWFHKVLIRFHSIHSRYVRFFINVSENYFTLFGNFSFLYCCITRMLC